MVRLKARYILFDVIYPNLEKEQENYLKKTCLLQHHSTSQNVNLRALSELVKRNIQLLFGDQGYGTAGISIIVKYFSQKTSTGIIRCSREYYKLICAALTIINKLNGKDVIFRIIKISGTIRKCEQSAIDRNKKLMKELKLKEFEQDDFSKISEDEDED
ncbi:Ribonuclease P/MRP protein subunit [Wickerhamomyces ciferrii]|uniref:Ribonuclease P/MRP protein subunit n=1 Tax=Wickerhamomyces ciferrii (strain ATCC 14091 / BCRC 22168 / CBS 111 / JCM 3599 / NBRC 0793 / NRRL Y-1031 F-60-10) TaxID=1206466 RepID=K0L0Z2_WICCF|nr:Ribonuclease P/MRP protein subunit [Wickerhamomyces ciferrii]CCH47123.1 Ribonuclease P/MRP protein subunit [Wickerhamomyces ciferrii]